MMSSKKTIPSFYDYCCFLLFLYFWIIPLIYMGIKHQYFPHMPKAMNFLHNSSALFISRTPSWPQYFIELQFKPDGPWIEYDYSDDFKMHPFGYRSRLNRFFELLNKKEPAHEELAQWILRRYSQKYPGEPRPIGMRFLDARTSVKSKGFNGHWENKPISAFAQTELFLISSLTLPNNDHP